MADSNTSTPAPSLTDEHRAFLAAQAVDIDLAESLGVRSLLSSDDTQAMGGHWVNWANFPALAFPWTSESGRLEYQVRPDNPTEGSRGKVRKYVFAKGMTPVLWAVRPVEGAKKIVIVEGTKQCLAAASYAPEGIGIYGIAGCRMWQMDGTPIPDLEVVDGREVVVILDADASDNPQVFDAGVALADALVMEGASKVTFGRLPGGADKSGLDDVLGGRAANRRATFLARVIEGAKAKPADAKPKGKGQKNGEKPTEGDGRETIVVNRDRWAVINDLTGALLARWNAVTLFCHGGVLSRRRPTGMHPVDKGTFNDVVQETAITVNENNGANGTTYSYAWPDAGVMSATLSRADQFAALDRISHAPFVREDGTVVTEPGYDESTRTMLIPDPVFENIKVPEDPTPAEIAAARDLILTEWLGDFPFDSDTDRANVVALIVTPAIRGMCPKVPLAVVDGLQMGVGKNLLADSLLTVYTGQAAEPMNWVSEPDELRKQITSAFRTGAEFFVFDEAHTIEGAPLAQALTAATWQDRILGVSTMANFPNVITWMSLGNQVQVKGDLTRRVYRIALRPTYANPQDREASSFRHPGQSGLDLGSWTRKHRRELMEAILTLVRAWFAQGQPRPDRGVSFGSFEVWERIVGGIIQTAGLTGFLDNLKVWRSESDFDTQYWLGHLKWLRQNFANRPFRTADVKDKALADPAGYPAPPKLDEFTEKGYGKALGEAYSRLRGRRYEGLWMERAGYAHGHVTLWTVNDQDDAPPSSPPAPPVPPVVPEPDDVCRCSRTERMYCHVSGCHGGADIPPENEHGEARGPAPEDLTGDSDEVRPPRQCVMAGINHLCNPKCEDLPEKVDSEVSTEPDFPATTAKRGGIRWGDGQASTEVVTFDLETGDAADLYKADPATYVRIGATAADAGEVASYGGTSRDVAEEVTGSFWTAGTVTGHNIMAFDLPALVRSGTITMPEVHSMAAEGRLFDTILAARYLDPPMARDKGVDATRKYDLGTLAGTYDLGGAKLSDTSKALAKKYGGWGEIPIDTEDPDPERAADAEVFRIYMVQDVKLSRELHAKIMDRLGGEVPEYLRREHRVAALAAQISHNGFLVDQPELARRVEGVNQLKARSLEWLAEHAGIPLANAKGVPHKAPLATKAGKEALEQAFLAAGVTSVWRTPNSGQFDISGDHMLHLARENHHIAKVREIAKNVYRIVGARSVYQTAMDHLCPDGRVHPNIGLHQATGRWSVTSPGLTVFGKRNGRHVERDVFLADPGEVLIAVDLSQVDMRAVAGLSQDQAYIEMLKSEDPHRELAIALFNDPGMREQAKAVGHGWNYGESLSRISNDNEIAPEIVRKFDQSMRERFGRLVEWREEVRAQASSGVLLDNGFGRPMRADPQRAHTQGPALMGQGAARDLMMEGLLRLPGEIRSMLRAQVHDEIVASVPADQSEDIGRIIVEAFTFEWRGVPILADVSRAGASWGRCYAKD